MYLNALFDVGAALAKGGIVPRGEAYNVEDVQAALNEHLGKGHFVQMNCLSDKKTGKTLLADTRLCMSIDWDLLDCPKDRKKQKTIAYPLPTFKVISTFFFLRHDRRISALPWTDYLPA